MKKPLFGVKIAILVANGFSEQYMTSAQKALIEAGANPRIVSPENGLVNGWDGSSWGHHFAVDAPLGEALAADYDMLVVPGGQRSLDKLNLTAHTKRFMTGFMGAGKPVAVMDDAIHLLMMTDNIKGRTVAGPETLGDVVMQAGGRWEDGVTHIDDNLLTGRMDDESRGAFITAMLNLFTSRVESQQAA